MGKATIIKRMFFPAMAMLCGFFLSPGNTIAGDAPSASSVVMRMYGREHGFCVVVGVQTDKAVRLAADLAASGKLLVHAISLDDASLLKARRQINARGLQGFAVVEKLPLAPMPYRDNLINIMIVPDLAQVAAAGFSKQNALRVVAPFGKLCIYDKGRWNVTEKSVPQGMDEWTHNVHGPDGNRVSHDTVVRFPVGYRWHGGLPFNINNRLRQGNRYSATRGMAVAAGRVFTFSDSVVDNLKPAYFQGQGLDQYVTARDAFSGLLLWRKKIGRVYYGGLWYMNMAPFAVVDNAVYTVCEQGDVMVLDAVTGKEVRRFDTTYAPGEILVDHGVLAVITWKGGTWVGESKCNRFERRRMHSAVAEGTIEAFDLETGSRLWVRNELATSIRTAGGILFAIRRNGADLLEESRRFKPRTKGGQPQPTSGKAETSAQKTFKRPVQTVLALDLKTGKSRWEISSAQLSKAGYEEQALRLDAAGLGVVTVVHCADLNSGMVSVLSARDGKTVLQVKSGGFPLLIDNAIHLAGKRYDPQTGKELGASRYRIGSTVCTPSYVVNGIIVRNRMGSFIVNGNPVLYGGARGACALGSIPAYGAFYTAQNWCTCCPSQISGFICFGPVDKVPTEKAMTTAPVPVKGEAFSSGSIAPAAQDECGNDWPMERHDPRRASATRAAPPAAMKVLWHTACRTPELTTPVARNWREYLNPPLTAPTAACGTIVVAAMDANQVIALDRRNGGILWTFDAGARVDSSPTIYRGTCIFGSHDGFVYSLDCRSGRLRWKLRLAPNNQRMISYGKVESPWPVIGSVLVTDKLAYASAGRTQGSDGDIVVRAFSPATGAVAWSRVLAPGRNVRTWRRNDIMLKVDGSIQLMVTRLDARTGKPVVNPTHEVNLYHQTFGSLKRNIARFETKLRAAGGKSSWIEKRLSQYRQQFAELKEPDGDISFSLGSRGRGSEGLVNWNWPSLGNRKYVQMNYGNVSGLLVSWDEKSVCAMRSDRLITMYPMSKVGKVWDKTKARAVWSVCLPTGYQATSLVLCPETVVAGGGIYAGKDDEAGRGFVCIMSRKNGKKINTHIFPAPVVYSGVIVMEKQICVALADSSVWLLGE